MPAQAAVEHDQPGHETQQSDVWMAKGFADAYGVKETTGAICLRRLVGKHCLVGGPNLNLLCDGCGGVQPQGHSYRDHVRGWTRKGKLVCITSEPYYIGRDQMEDLMRIEDEFGLHVWVRGDSFYNPGRTMLVMIYTDELDDTPGTWNDE